jgi:hypothetical protein
MANSNVTTREFKPVQKITWEIKDCLNLFLVPEKFLMTMKVGQRVYSLHFQNNGESITCVLTLKPQSGEHSYSYCELSAHTPKFQFKSSPTRSTFTNSGCYWTFENFLRKENFLNQAKRIYGGNTMTIVCKFTRRESSTEVEDEPAARTSSGTSQAITRLWRTGVNCYETHYKV